MFSSENPYTTKTQEKHPDEELIKPFDKIRTLITHPIKGSKVKEALVGLVLKHPEIGDMIASAVQSPDKMQEFMEKYPHLTGYTGRPMSERARESGNQEMLDYINQIQEEMTAPRIPEIPEEIAHLFQSQQAQEAGNMNPAPAMGMAAPAGMAPPAGMSAPAITPAPNRPTNPISGKLMGMGGM